MAGYPYFQFYPGDWLSSPSVVCSTLAQQGAYLRLLCFCWTSGDCSIPDDDKKLAILSGLPEQELEFVRSVFRPHPTKPLHLTNERLMKEWQKAHETSARRAEAGVKSGEARRKHPRTFVRISESESESELELDSELRKNKKKEKTCAPPPVVAVCAVVEPTYSPAFERFWARFPNKTGKKAAWRAWQKARDRPGIDELLTAVNEATQSDRWQRGYIPNPATWLNQGRWADRVTPAVRPARTMVEFMAMHGGVG